jgi:chloramphenicol 3-O-phosphotransferase
MVVPMQGSLVILTGASGSGKTTLACAVQAVRPDDCEFIFFDSIGVPSPEKMKEFGDGYQPGGAWQRAMTLQWMEQIAELLRNGKSVLFEGQMRVKFILEAMEFSKVPAARVILVDCDDATRIARLTVAREQPELADEGMMGWARYLREEASQMHCEVLDTGIHPLEECVDLVRTYLSGSTTQDILRS